MGLEFRVSVCDLPTCNRPTQKVGNFRGSICHLRTCELPVHFAVSQWAIFQCKAVQREHKPTTKILGVSEIAILHFPTCDLPMQTFRSSICNLPTCDLPQKECRRGKLSLCDLPTGHLPTLTSPIGPEANTSTPSEKYPKRAPKKVPQEPPEWSHSLAQHKAQIGVDKERSFRQASTNPKA